MSEKGSTKRLILSVGTSTPLFGKLFKNQTYEFVQAIQKNTSVFLFAKRGNCIYNAVKMSRISYMSFGGFCRNFQHVNEKKGLAGVKKTRYNKGGSVYWQVQMQQ